MTAIVAASQADGVGAEVLCEDGEVPAYLPEWTVADVVAFLRAQPDCVVGNRYPLKHQFAPGVYAREITMPTGHLVVGRVHKTEHFNIISKGDVSFWMPGEAVRRVQAPYTFRSACGAQKVLYVHEETVWTTIHPTDETDVETLEALLAEPNPLLLDPPSAVETVV